MRILYSVILYTVTPLFFLRLLFRARKAPSYLERWNERLAVYQDIPVSEPVIWIHAVSVGEVEAAFPLIQKIQKIYSQYSVLVTTTTPTGSSRVKSLFGEKVGHVYLPYDLPVCVKRFYAHFQPVIGIVMETEIWPNLFYYAGRRDIPIIIVNARLSPKSKARYVRIHSFVKSTLGPVSTIAAQSKKDADAFIEIGAESEKLRVIGNVKFDLVLPKEIYGLAAELRKKVFIQRPVLVAASTHEGEEEQILDAFLAIKNKIPELLLNLVPRHPERFDTVARLCQSKNFVLVRRSEQVACTQETDVFLGDTLGELKGFYAGSELAFVGGSLTPTGGHNVLEPAALGIPVIVGQSTFNFEEITRLLIAAGAAMRVNNSKELTSCVLDLMADKRRRGEMGEKGSWFVQKNRGAIDRTMECIASIIP